MIGSIILGKYSHPLTINSSKDVNISNESGTLVMLLKERSRNSKLVRAARKITSHNVIMVRIFGIIKLKYHNYYINFV